MRILRRADFNRMRWKNGAGWSYEIAARTPPGAPFEWRVSIATIEQPGPFSSYEGYGRWTVLIKGQGFELDSASATSLRFSRIGQLHAYSGAIAWQCRLLGGEAWDLNLIAREGSGASMSVAELGAMPFEAGDAREGQLLFPVDAGLGIDAGAGRQSLEAWDAVMLQPGERASLVPAAGSARVQVAIVRLPAATALA